MNEPRKKNSFSYFLSVNGEKIRVCKAFFLGTLLISHKSVYNVHINKDKTTGTPKSDEWGKKTRDRISKYRKDFVRKHIDFFPKAESHYCRAVTQKEYLDSNLNITRMYDLYKEECLLNNSEPVKQSLYQGIFNNEFNFEFLAPKSDRCDLCEEYHIAIKENRINQDLSNRHNIHLKEKTYMREEWKHDRDNNLMVICFDLQNVIALPRANVSSFFYKRKLNVYNLTGHVSKGKQDYCIIWNEALCGISGNDIASAVVKLLSKIMDKKVSEYILWSDSCVPQNRNSLISLALTSFIQKHKKYYNEIFNTRTLIYSRDG